jgi:putative colanic acid biosynthesis UDP-glucose lipid carrier transferase
VEIIAVAGDVLIVCLAAWAAFFLRFHNPEMTASYMYPVALAAVLSANIFRWRRLYDLETYAHRARHLLKLLGAQTMVLLVLVAIGFGLKTSADFSRLWMGMWMLMSTAGLAVWFLIRCYYVRAAQERGRLRDRLLIVGDTERVASFTAWLKARTVRRLNILGTLPVAEGGSTRQEDLQKIPRMVEQLRPDRVLLLVDWRDSEVIASCVKVLRSLAVDVELVLPRLGEEWVGRPVSRLDGVQAMNLMRSPLSQEARFLKRAEDYVVSLLLLAILAPLFVFVAILIKLDSKGPVFFRQSRSGFEKSEFSIFKFRTMRAEPDAPFRQASQGDERVTRLGRFLRATSIDELPQLLNVLKGEMSLVGPRPHEVSMNAAYAEQIDDYLVRHRIKPGITGWAQVNGARGETRTLADMKRRLSYDLDYVDNWSIWLDLQILLRTCAVFLFQKNAY